MPSKSMSYFAANGQFFIFELFENENIVDVIGPVPEDQPGAVSKIATIEGTSTQDAVQKAKEWVNQRYSR